MDPNHGVLSAGRGAAFCYQSTFNLTLATDTFMETNIAFPPPLAPDLCSTFDTGFFEADYPRHAYPNWEDPLRRPSLIHQISVRLRDNPDALLHRLYLIKCWATNSRDHQQAISTDIRHLHHSMTTKSFHFDLDTHSINPRGNAHVELFCIPGAAIKSIYADAFHTQAKIHRKLSLFCDETVDNSAPPPPGSSSRDEFITSCRLEWREIVAIMQECHDMKDASTNRRPSWLTVPEGPLVVSPTYNFQELEDNAWDVVQYTPTIRDQAVTKFLSDDWGRGYRGTDTGVCLATWTPANTHLQEHIPVAFLAPVMDASRNVVEVQLPVSDDEQVGYPDTTPPELYI